MKTQDHPCLLAGQIAAEREDEVLLLTGFKTRSVGHHTQQVNIPLSRGATKLAEIKSENELNGHIFVNKMHKITSIGTV
jgi:hypothetical protein